MTQAQPSLRCEIFCSINEQEIKLQWLTSISPATQEAEIRIITVQSQPSKRSHLNNNNNNNNKKKNRHFNVCL
jgi:hypothetical protein